MRSVLSAALVVLLPAAAGATTYTYDWTSPTPSIGAGPVSIRLEVDFDYLRPDSIFGGYQVNQSAPSGAMRALGFGGIVFPDEPWTSEFGFAFGFSDDHQIRWWHVNGQDMNSEAEIRGCLACELDGSDFGRVWYAAGILDERVPLLSADGAGTWTRGPMMVTPIPAPALLLMGGLAGLGLAAQRKLGRHPNR